MEKTELSTSLDKYSIRLFSQKLEPTVLTSNTNTKHKTHVKVLTTL